MNNAETKYWITAEAYFAGRSDDQLQKDKDRMQYLLDRDSGKLHTKDPGMPWMVKARESGLEAINNELDKRNT